MRVRIERVIGVAAALTAAACNPVKPPVAPPALPITRATLDETLQATVAAITSGDAAKVGASYSTDATLINARGRFDSQLAITRFWVDGLKSPMAGKNLNIAIERWGTSGDIAYTLSRFTGGVTAPSGYVLSISKRRTDGTLKTVIQVSIPDPPAK